MLSLDAGDWTSLHHAYGPATDIPGLLRRVAADPRPYANSRDEPWFSLWSSLCHQGDAYTASYAAVPHFVQIALNAPGPIDYSLLLLPTCIEIARLSERGPIVPPHLAEAYFRAIRRLHECVCVHANDPWDADAALVAAAAFAVSKGHTRIAEALLKLDDDMIEKINAGEFAIEPVGRPNK